MGQAKTSRKKKIIIIIMAVVVISAGAVAAYLLLKDKDGEAEPGENKGTTYVESFQANQSKASALIDGGDEKAIAEAEQIVEKEVEAAEKSGNDSYIVDAQLAKAQVLIETGRPQEALDSILFPLEKKYASNQEYGNVIYSMIAFAYKYLENQEKVDEYYEKVVSEGWN